MIASTLMVPGHIDAQQIGSIARLITSLNPELPYSLLAFHPDDKMADLLITSRKEAQECLEAASEAGLRRVNVGNMHLPGEPDVIEA